MATLHYDRSKVDLTNCDIEPIHIPGSIQPQGAMIVVDNATGLVSFASENLGEYLGDTDHDYRGAELSNLLGNTVSHDLGNAAARAGAGHIAGIVLNADLGSSGKSTDISIHRFEGRTIVELEPPASSQDTEVALHLTQSLVRRIDGQTQFDPLVRTVARMVRATLGYDRVMVYRFLHNGAGRVVAEARDPALGSFMGQHFPMSDIPAQARKLYIQNWVRVIGDVSFVPVALSPPLKDDEAAVDLSHAHLRSVSPIHCEYLQNMGVAASMSISIVVEGELWGLIACHHNTPKWLSLPLRVATELFAQYFSLHVAAIENRIQKQAAAVTRARLETIISNIDPADPVETTLQNNLKAFASLIACDGIALWSRGTWTSSGETPDKGDVPALMAVVAPKAGRNIWDTQDLRSATGQEDLYGGRVAGVLAIPISVSSPDYLLFFRSEEAHQIAWAGEPKKRVEQTARGDRLSPRGSFDLWREDVRHKSIPWTDADVVVAEAVKNYVRDVMLSHNDATEEYRERTENQRKLLNAELNHRVKNILALVKSIASQTGANAETVEDYTNSFEGRLRALAYAHDQSFAGAGGGELRGLIEAEAGMHRFTRTPDRISLTGEPVGLTERSFGVFALLLHEMMTNAAKYGSLSVPSGQLDISWTLAGNGDCHLHWIESGGPPVIPPTRKGFGSTLIEKTVSHDLGGDAVLDFASDGLKATFVIPARHLHAVSEREIVVPSSVPVPDRPLDGLKVLLVEDQSLIAMDTEELLLALGASEVMVAASVEGAMGLLHQKPNCAVLDLNLGSETSERVANSLAQLGIPYVFATGYRDSVSIPDQFAGVPVVRKPLAEAPLATALQIAVNALSV